MKKMILYLTLYIYLGNTFIIKKNYSLIIEKLQNQSYYIAECSR